jgi:hypothetical protein
MATVGPSTGVYGRDAILAARKNASSQTQNSNTNPSSVGQAASSGGSKTSTSTPTSSAKRVKVNPDGKAPKAYQRHLLLKPPVVTIESLL